MKLVITCTDCGREWPIPPKTTSQDSLVGRAQSAAVHVCARGHEAVWGQKDTIYGVNR